MACNLSLSGLGSNPYAAQSSLWYKPKVIFIAHPVRGEGCLVSPLADVAMMLITSLCYIHLNGSVSAIFWCRSKRNLSCSSAYKKIPIRNILAYKRAIFYRTPESCCYRLELRFSFSVSFFCCRAETIYTLDFICILFFFLCQEKHEEMIITITPEHCCSLPLALPPIIALQLITKAAVAPIIS